MPPDGCPAIRRDQPRTAGPWPAGEGISTPTAGPGPETRDLNTPSTGPRCLQRATSIRSGSAPSWANLKESESILETGPGLRDAPRFLGRETLESQTTV